MDTKVVIASRRVTIHQAATCAGGLMVGLAMIAIEVLWQGPRKSFRLALYGLVVCLSSIAWLAMAAVHWALPSRLTLAPDGLTIEQALKNTQRIRWTDVERFYVDGGERTDRVAISRDLLQIFRPLRASGSGTVSYQLVRSARLNSLALGSDSGFGRATALPSDDFQQSSTELAELLNAYRERALGGT
jgi:hypothetical protein